MGTTRRKFLKGTGAAAAGVMLGCTTPSTPGAPVDDGGAGSGDLAPAPPDLGGAPDLLPAAPVEPPEPVPLSAAFTLGIASGDVTPGRAVLWTRYQGTHRLRAEVWQMRGEVYEQKVASADVMPADGGFVHVEVDGLSAGERYRYAFFELEINDRLARSEIGHFRAAIADDALEPLTIGASCCTSNGRQFPTLAHAGQRGDLDAFLLLGDTAYCDGARTVADYRGRWQQNLATDGYRALRLGSSVVATWDDHEVANDWDPEKTDVAQVAAARQVFFENLPTRRDGAAPERIWRRLRWGRTLEIFVLDCRGERLPSTKATPGAQYLSRAQMDWLKAGLKSSPAAFKLIVNSVPITQWPGLQGLGSGDTWVGYAAQRTEILQHIESEYIGGVMWVAGDHHFGSVGRVAPSGLGSAALEVLAGPGGQAANPIQPPADGKQLDWVSGLVNYNNYAAFAFDPASKSVRITFHDETGKPLFDRIYYF